MKNIFNKISLDVSQPVIDSIIDVICSQKVITRATIAEMCGVSIATVSKVARALIDSGTVIEKRLTHEVTLSKRACNHLSVSRRVCTAVIDLSTSVYSFDIICGGETYFRHSLKYNSDVTFEDNLYTLLSRSFGQMRLKDNFSLSICIIYSDLQDRDNVHAYLPGMHDKEIINGAVFDICRQIPLLYIPKTRAAYGVSKFNIVSKADGFGGISYMSLGSVNSGFFVNGDRIISCRLNDLIISDGITLRDFTRNYMSKSDFELLLERSVNFMDSAFGAQTLIIETDLFKADYSYVRSLERKFASMRLTLPDIYPIYVDDDVPSILILSAARQAEAKLIRSYITGK